MDRNSAICFHIFQCYCWVCTVSCLPDYPNQFHLSLIIRPFSLCAFPLSVVRSSGFAACVFPQFSCLCCLGFSDLLSVKGFCIHFFGFAPDCFFCFQLPASFSCSGFSFMLSNRVFCFLTCLPQCFFIWVLCELNVTIISILQEQMQFFFLHSRLICFRIYECVCISATVSFSFVFEPGNLTQIPPLKWNFLNDHLHTSSCMGKKTLCSTDLYGLKVHERTHGLSFTPSR